MSDMGASNSSADSGTVTRKQTNVSVNENEAKQITLTYRSVGAAKKAACSFTWTINDAGTDYYGEMEAKDGNVVYFHKFAKPVPEAMKTTLKEPSKAREGDAVVFTFTRPHTTPPVSLQSYVRQRGQ